MNTDPFLVLSLAPTLDPHAIKGAYFAALKRSPPHADPEGFQRIRRAYEQLTKAGGAAAAFYAAPPPETTLAVLDARWRALVDEARAKGAAEHARREVIERFVASASTRTLRELLGPRRDA